MEKDSQKRKCKDVTLSTENKKSNKDIDFSRTQISAESTLISSQNLSLTANSILERMEETMSNSEVEINSAFAEQIVTVIEDKSDDSTPSKQLISLLRKELEEKDKELEMTRQVNINLLSKLEKLKSDQVNLENKVTDFGHKVKRYQWAVVELNKLARVVIKMISG